MAAKRRSHMRVARRRKVATVASTAARAPRQVGEAELQRAFAAFEHGNYDEAIRVWQAAQRASAPPPALGAALAEAYFRRALETSPGSPRPSDGAPPQNGHAHSSRSIEDLQQAVALAPQAVAYQFHLALAHHRAGDLERARAAYEAASRLTPQNARVRRHLALALLGFEHDPAALEQAKNVLAGAPAREEVGRRLRALVFLRAGDPSAAMAALDGQPNARASPFMALTRGLLQLAAGQREAGQGSLSTALEAGVQRRPAGSARARPDQSLDPSATALAGAAALAVIAARLGGGDLTGAFETLQRTETPAAPALQPIFATTCYRLAVALALDERVVDAASTLERALSAEPARVEARRAATHLHELAGVQAARRTDYEAAARHWEAALGYGGETVRPRLLHNLALAEERLQRWEQASSRWEELVRQWRKELQEARQRRGPSGKGGTPAEAQGAPPTGAARHTPEELRRWLAVAYRHQAGALEAAGDPRAAIRTLQRALNFDSANLDLRRRLAELYLDDDQYRPAIEQLERLHAAHPTDTNVLLELGSALDLNGDERQAQRYLEQAMALEPENEAVKQTLASVHQGRAVRLTASGASERALVEYLQAVELAPRQTSHRVGLGTLYLKLGQLAAAQGSFGRAMELAPQDGSTRLLIGIAYLGYGQQKLADQLFRQALRLDRSLVMQAGVGIAYFRGADPSKAAPYFSRVLKGRDAFALTTVGQMLMDAGRANDALPYLERAVEISPLSAGAHMALAYARAFGQGDHARAAAELEAAKFAAELLDDRELLSEIAQAHAVNASLADLKAGELR